MIFRVLCAVFIGFLGACGHQREDVSTYQLPYENQIIADLAPFSQGILRQKIRQAYHENTAERMLVKVSKSGRVTFETTHHSSGSRKDVVVGLVQQAIYRFGPLPPIEFVFNIMDEPLMRKDSGDLLPIFSFSVTQKYTDIAFPMIASGDFLRMDDVLRDVKARAVPFEQKKDLLVWRGSQTGQSGRMYDEHNWHEFPRSRLVLFCQNRPDMCDAGFSNYTQVTPAGRKSIQKAVGLKQSISMENMQAYRYIASLDGNTWPDRFPRLLATNSLIFKEESEFYSFFDLTLKPNVHYVSIKSDMSDLEEKIIWARNNPQQVMDIIRNANEFADRYLNQGSVEAYVYKLLLKYSELLR